MATGVLLLLVGRNPLPLLLAAATVQPARAVLVHTQGPEGSEAVAGRVRTALQRRLGIEQVDLVPLRASVFGRT